MPTGLPVRPRRKRIWPMVVFIVITLAVAQAIVLNAIYERKERELKAAADHAGILNALNQIQRELRRRPF